MQKNNDEIANAYDHLTPKDFPIAYRANKWFFCGLEFYINKHVLVPRAETEALVKYVIARSEVTKQSSILDLCTGSGCIAIALAKNGFTNITATDISKKALKVAKKNARKHQVEIKFLQSDLFEKARDQFDIMVCNPPYIKTTEIGRYDKSTLHEPKIALDGGIDGLWFYRKIISQAKCNQIFFEVGDKTQGNAVKTLLQNAGFCDIQITGNHIIHARKVN
jgi:release factor glutamine methyltransferase